MGKPWENMEKPWEEIWKTDDLRRIDEENWGGFALGEYIYNV
jgi:hypothetical protein